MTTGYLGEIRLMAGLLPNGPPSGWAVCDGSVLTLNGSNQGLFRLLGNTFGGDPRQNTFALPDLRSRVPVSMGNGPGVNQGETVNYKLGEAGGLEQVTLTPGQLPYHSHAVNATDAPATTTSPGPTVLPADVGNNLLYAAYAPAPFGATQTLAGGTVMPAVNTTPTPHENRMPSIAMLYIICVEGEFPSGWEP